MPAIFTIYSVKTDLCTLLVGENSITGKYGVKHVYTIL